MWIYEQRTGRLYQDSDLETVFLGYAGFGDGKNNPAMQHLHDLGPLPCGFYDIGPPEDHPATIGLYALPLKPAPENEMFGRGSFYMHGESNSHPGFASHGCPIQSKPARMAVHLSEDRPLKVIPGV